MTKFRTPYGIYGSERINVFIIIVFVLLFFVFLLLFCLFVFLHCIYYFRFYFILEKTLPPVETCQIIDRSHQNSGSIWDHSSTAATSYVWDHCRMCVLLSGKFWISDLGFFMQD